METYSREVSCAVGFEQTFTKFITRGLSPLNPDKAAIEAGIRNLFKLYIPICDYWMIFDNSRLPSELVAEGYMNNEIEIKNISTFELLKNKAEND